MVESLKACQSLHMLDDTYCTCYLEERKYDIDIV